MIDKFRWVIPSTPTPAVVTHTAADLYRYRNGDGSEYRLTLSEAAQRRRQGVPLTLVGVARGTKQGRLM